MHAPSPMQEPSNSYELLNQFTDAERKIQQHQQGIQEQLTIMRTLMQNYRPSRQGDVHGDATGGPSGYATNAFDSPMHSGYAPRAFTCDVGVEATPTAIDEDNIDDIVTNTEPLAAVIVPIPSRKLRTTRVRQMASQLLSPFLTQPHIRESTIKLNLKAAAKLVFDLEGEASDELVTMHASHLTRGNLGCFEGNGWIGNHVMDVYSRMMQFDDHTHSRLFLTPYIADMIIKTQSNCIKKDAIMRRFVCNLYQMDIQYSSVKEIGHPRCCFLSKKHIKISFFSDMWIVSCIFNLIV